jgi:hypothetical protein
MQAAEEMEDEDDLGVSAYDRKFVATMQMDNLVGVSDRSRSTPSSPSRESTVSSGRSVDIEVELAGEDSDDENLGEFFEEGPELEIKVLPKPPSQDINFVKKSDQTVSDALIETRHKTHQMFGHLFNDRPYKLSLVGEKKARRSSNLFRSKSQMILPRSKKHRFPHRPRLATGSKKGSSMLQKTNNPEKQGKMALTVRKDEYDRLLHLSKYSHSNVIVSKVAVIVQPLAEIVHLFLGMFRAVFNIFTWRDPFFTFWVIIFGSILVVVLHCFPWRIVLGVIGVGFVGPQNWILRLVRERKKGYQPEDFDILVKKKKEKKHEFEDEDRFFFSSIAPDNRPVRDEELDTSDFKEVAVPHTQLNYRRFYDWPPEPSYARVWKCGAPESDPVAEQILQDDAFELYDGSCGDDVSVKGGPRRGWSNRARRLVKGVTRVPKVPKVPTLLRRRKKLERLEENSI